MAALLKAEIVVKGDDIVDLPSDSTDRLLLEKYIKAKKKWTVSQTHDDDAVAGYYKEKIVAISRIAYPERSYDWVDEEPREYIVLSGEGKKRLDVVVNFDENLEDKLKELLTDYKTIEQKKEEERRKNVFERRKMFRWERWHACKHQFLIHNAQTVLQGKTINGVHACWEQSKTPKKIRYFDSLPEIIQPPPPVMTAAPLVRNTVVKTSNTTNSSSEATLDKPDERQVEKIEKGKSVKKDKKKKKRKSSSSSDDLETLEKRSEARLGLRK